MCGIFLTSRPSEFGFNWQEQMKQYLLHRGPDGQVAGEWSGIGAAHTRLAVIGLGSEGSQPMTSEGQEDVLVFNGEIVNYAAIAARRGIHARSDTRLLLHLLSEGWLSELSELRGMFAFVYWNARTRTLTALRDRYGIKPLFVLQHASGGVTFASEMRALLAHPDAQAIDPVGLAHYLAEGHTGQSGTIVSTISKLVPGLRYSWHLDMEGHARQERIEPLGTGTWPHMAVREALEDSVRAHLVADVEVGMFLSGGVDSTLIAALAAREQSNLQAFTLGFPESPENDETEIARHNASLMGLRHTVVNAHANDLADIAREIVSRTGEPLGDAAVLPLALLARKAREHVPVVLAGEGADEIFGGYRRYRVDKWVAHSPSLLPNRAIQTLSRHRGPSRNARSIEALLWGRSRGFQAHSALLTGEFPAVMDAAPGPGGAALSERIADWAGLDPDFGSRALAYDRSIWLPNTYLEKTDRASMLSGLEARVPFLDPVVQLSVCARDLADQTKAPLRELLSQLVPNRRLPGVKKGLAVDVEALLRGELAGPLEYELNGSDSILACTYGLSAQRILARRSSISPNLAFRIAQLGLWQEAVNAS
jgi:asparagine synthase (glutamine-hydrolysing)